MEVETIRAWNTHWQTGSVSPLVCKHPARRDVVPAWTRDLVDPPGGQWSIRAGARQVGKTTSLGHVAAALMSEHGVEPRHVVYVPLDHEDVLASSGASLESVIQACMAHAPPSSGRPLYLLLDEIQAFPDWAARLKGAWDKHHRLVRVLATGSSAMRLLHPTEADFLGRIRTTAVHPMSFGEVLRAHPGTRNHVDDPARMLAGPVQVVRQALPAGHEATGEAVEGLHAAVAAVEGLEAFLANTWREHCTWGGYPAVRAGSGKDAAQRLEFFQASWNAVLARDVVHSGVEKLREFGLLHRHISRHPGGRFAPHSVGSRLETRGETIAHWKLLLEDVLLVRQLPPLKPRLAPARGKDKAYPADAGWTSYWLGCAETALPATAPVLGLQVEGMLVDHLHRLQAAIVGTTAMSSGYVADPEVDIALDLGPRWLLVEAKYRAGARPDALLEAGAPGDVRIVATRDRFRRGGRGEPHQVPAHELALVC